MENQQKIFWQVMDCLRGPLPEEQLIELALQVIVWEKLSHEGELYPDLTIQHYLDHPTRGSVTLSNLRQVPEGVGEAFTHVAPTHGSGAPLRAAAELLLRLRAAGMLEKPWSFDVTAQLSPRSGFPALPAELADLMIKLAELQPHQTVYLPWDSSAQLAMRASNLETDALVETPVRSQIQSLVSLLVNRPFEIIHGDPIRDPDAHDGGRLRKFDAVVALPPFGVRYDLSVVDGDLWGRFAERTQAGSVLAIRHILAQAKGRCIVAVPNSFLFSSGPEATCRQSLLERGQLRAVIALPPILPASALSISLLVLEAAGGFETVRVINGDDDLFRASVSKSRAKLTEIDLLASQLNTKVQSSVMREISIKEVASNDWNLEVGRYLLGSAAEHLQMTLMGSETVVVQDVAEVVRPLPTARDGDGIPVFEVGAADLPAYGYIGSASRQVVVEAGLAERNSHQFLRPFDIVLVVKGSVGKVGIVPPEVPKGGEGGWIAGQSAIVLRSRGKGQLDAHSLLVQLRAPVGQALLKMITSGASIPLIQVRELQQLRLFAPNAETAARARDAVDQESEIQREIDALRERQVSIAAGLWQLDGNA